MLPGSTFHHIPYDTLGDAMFSAEFSERCEAAIVAPARLNNAHLIHLGIGVSGAARQPSVFNGVLRILGVRASEQMSNAESNMAFVSNDFVIGDRAESDLVSNTMDEPILAANTDVSIASGTDNSASPQPVFTGHINTRPERPSRVETQASAPAWGATESPSAGVYGLSMRTEYTTALFAVPGILDAHRVPFGVAPRAASNSVGAFMCPNYSMDVPYGRI